MLVIPKFIIKCNKSTMQLTPENLFWDSRNLWPDQTVVKQLSDRQAATFQPPQFTESFQTKPLTEPTEIILEMNIV